MDGKQKKELVVKLTQKDLKYAESIAKKRNKSQRDGGRKDGKVLKDSLSIDIQGAEAELAVAKALKLPWDGSFLDLDKWFNWRDNGHDVSGLEVRSTNHKKGCLLIHPRDKDDSPYILVLTYDRPTFILAGWNFGKAAKFGKYWRDVGYGRPCYYLPQTKLLEMTSLKTIHSDNDMIKTTIELPEDIHIKAKKHCAQNDKTLSHLCTDLICEEIERASGV